MIYVVTLARSGRGAPPPEHPPTSAYLSLRDTDWKAVALKQELDIEEEHEDHCKAKHSEDYDGCIGVSC